MLFIYMEYRLSHMQFRASVHTGLGTAGFANENGANNKRNEKYLRVCLPKALGSNRQTILSTAFLSSRKRNHKQ